MTDIYKHQLSIANENTKLIVSTFATWFTFFWTLNMAAVAWLYHPEAICAAASQMGKVRLVASLTFVVLNLIGIGVCYVCWKSVSHLRAEAVAAATAWMLDQNPSSSTEPSAGLLPTAVARYVFAGSAISLIVNILLWGGLQVLHPGPSEAVGSLESATTRTVGR